MRNPAMLLLLLASVTACSGKTIVHLFEWSWLNIAAECEQHLGPKGFDAVQISPPQENVGGSYWASSYQPVSYEIGTERGGTREEFAEMVRRCAAVGVDIYADAVINHMGHAGRTRFPRVPYGPEDFHPQCPGDTDYNDRTSVQLCDLGGLSDLRTETESVRGKIAGYLNDLIGLGVKGFRIDAAKHIPAADLESIVSRLSDPSAFIFIEFVMNFFEPVQASEYFRVGRLTDFYYERFLAEHFKEGGRPISEMRGLEGNSGWLSSEQSITFACNHDDQRHGRDHAVTYHDGTAVLTLAEVFSMAYPFGTHRVLSSYYFTDNDAGPPAAGPNTGGACGQQGGWVCEHRIRGIANMAGWSRAAEGANTISNWYDNGGNQIAFGRGGRAFVAINKDATRTMVRTLSTGLAPGSYCDVISGDFAADRSCTGLAITVEADGTALFSVPPMTASAIHVNARISSAPVTPLWSQAFFRGTPNGWAAETMEFVDGLWTTTQTFGASNPRFKIDRRGDWSESYPSQDYRISSPGTYRVTFNDRSHEVEVERVSGETPSPTPAPVARTPAPAIRTPAPVARTPAPPAPVTPLWSQAFFRGTPNGWAAETMEFVDGLWTTTQTFGASNPRFKIDRRGDWSESYPSQDYRISSPGTYRVTFNDRSHEIEVERVSGETPPPTPAPVARTPAPPAPVTPLWSQAFFRGTPNGWAAETMEFVDGLWTTTQTFGASNPRFKIDRRGDWSESYPRQDYRINSPGTYRVTFNDRTLQVAITRL